jgi:hypothetical protein
MMEDAGPVCLGCADVDHLVFLASGDAALTRRAKANSRLSAVVVRFSRARRRYERQGILVEEAALDRAEAECLADEEARARRRERDALRRGDQDLELQARMAAEIARLFPGCPVERAHGDRASRVGARLGPGRALGRGSRTRSRGARAGGRGGRPPRGHPLRHAADVRRRARSGAGRGPLAGSSGARRVATLMTGSRRTPICEPEPRLRRAASTRQEPSAAKSWTRMSSRPRGSTRATLADLS